MPSPFPGMNPYIEQDDAWHEFHDAFIPLAMGALNSQVGAGYIVKTDRHLYVHPVPPQVSRFVGRSDVHVASPRDPITAASGAVSVAPAVALFPMEDLEEESFIEIRDRHGRQVVTVVELLSPSNKRPGENRNAYLAKRRHIRTSTAHFVEIDLIRGWPRMPLDEAPASPYCVVVSRYETRPRVDVWPVSLREPLPRIPIPLRAPDADVYLDLQDLLHRAYDLAGFDRYIYLSEPEPPLSPEDAEWARQFVPPAKS